MRTKLHIGRNEPTLYELGAENAKEQFRSGETRPDMYWASHYLSAEWAKGYFDMWAKLSGICVSIPVAPMTIQTR